MTALPSGLASGLRLTIPEIRHRLHCIAADLGDSALARELHYLADQTYRKPSARRRTPTRHRRLTEEEIDRIREYAGRNPQASLQQIAVVFKTNHGRVSEAISGKRA